MQGEIDHNALVEAIASAGMTQVELADRVRVDEQAVSSWCRGDGQPRARHLLAVCLALGISRDQLAHKGSSTAKHVVNFRLKRNQPVRPELQKEAEAYTGYLRHLQPYLPEQYCSGDCIRNPQFDYGDIQAEASRFRERLGLASMSTGISIARIISYITGTGTVVVPVPWGDPERRANGLRVAFTDPESSWLYINIDTPILDARFWLIHEIAHMLTPSLSFRTDEEGIAQADEYADAFAQAVLCPESVASTIHASLRRKGPGAKVNIIKKAADGMQVSPYTVFLAVEAYAAHHRTTRNKAIAGSIGGAATKMAKVNGTLSNKLFGRVAPSGKEYVAGCAELFGSAFFDALATMIREDSKGPGIVARLMSIAMPDAIELYRALGDHGATQDSC